MLTHTLECGHHLLAKHFASHGLDPEPIAEETLRTPPVVHALQVSDDGIDALLEIDEIIQAPAGGMPT